MFQNNVKYEKYLVCVHHLNTHAVEVVSFYHWCLYTILTYRV